MFAAVAVGKRSSKEARSAQQLAARAMEAREDLGPVVPAFMAARQDGVPDVTDPKAPKNVEASQALSLSSTSTALPQPTRAGVIFTQGGGSTATPSIISVTGTETSSATPDPNSTTASSAGLGGSSSSSPSGLGNGAKIGLGVGIPILLILIGAAVFLILRRKKAKQHAHSEKYGPVVMISGGKHGLEEDQSSGGAPGASAGYLQQQPSEGTHMYPAAGAPGVLPAGAAPMARRTQVDEEELMNRPVSPVHDDDLLEGVAGGSTHTAGRAGAGASVRDRGSPSLDDDGEMQWILEEERKAKERKAQQQRLPTHS